MKHMLLSPAAMASVDAAAAASGIDSFGLMIRAGEAVAASALRHYPDAVRFLVLCGPGNNGGDGYVAAAALKRSGCTVEVFALGDRSALKGDAQKASDSCSLSAFPLQDCRPGAGDVVIDALFGAGLARDLPAEALDVIARARAARIPVLAVDLPSGLCGRRGIVLGDALAADVTVTFMCRKPGHVLVPGRDLCGTVEVFDIGIPERILTAEHTSVHENSPDFWRNALPGIGSGSHKFTRGHLGVLSGPPISTGAARMTAMAGLKAGAGLVTMAGTDETIPALAPHLTAVMMKSINHAGELSDWVSDLRLTAFVLGPGFGIGESARSYVHTLAARKLVLDADGISSFASDPAALFSHYSEGETRLVMTPHEGEFARLFPDLASNSDLSKVEKAVMAAKRSHGILVYKGADTVIAAPDGQAMINTNAPPWLATAGSGDVLAGIIAGLLAQGMPAFHAACAGVWFHGRAGIAAGHGLTAEDLLQHVGTALRPIHCC